MHSSSKIISRISQSYFSDSAEVETLSYSDNLFTQPPKASLELLDLLERLERLLKK